ncbi:MAG: glycosyltransferase family 4 protein [Proteobacteria bacterium]|nr:glycosyltransferase family 4 protein [Pseudomonadota bacterium]
MPKRALKILQVVPYFYPAWAYGGIPRVVFELSRELVSQGHDVSVYTTDVLDKDSRYPKATLDSEIEGIKVSYFKNFSNKLAHDFQIYLPEGMRGMVEETLSSFDIIHLHGHRHFLNNIVRSYAKKLGKPYILSGHGTVVRIERRVAAKAVFDKLFGEKVLRDAAGFVAVSENEVAQYEEFGVDKGKVRVIYNGIDVDAYESLPEKGAFREKYGLKGKEVILFLGKITPRKGVDFLVKAFALLSRPNAVLVIAGNDMGFKSEVENIIKELGLGDRVIFTGLLVDDEKSSAYMDADVLVYPAIHEIFGLVPFEALMCGTVPIVTDDCGCGEIIGSEGIGYLVKYEDAKGLAKKIDEVLDDYSGAEQKVAKGQSFIRERLSWKRVVKEYESVYEEFAL